MPSFRANADEPMKREEATLIILAGGEGQRMGFPKHELPMGETNILEWIHHRLGDLFVETIAAGRGISSSNQEIRIVEDRHSERAALVVHFYSEVRVREIREQEIREFDPILRSFVNLNTPTDRNNAASLDIS